ncbi:restriction endonuclease subunit S [Bacteroides finegoldii]|uniref:Type I restriction enzyme EcoR124II protein n=2 Tax=Bacteroides finegoldii TaxID=338188 RepID=A0A173Y0T9_9BACE|nr:restriction endonuclease subunit S [Bacteroides finegoldii]CUN57499.1 type I restriction enzyme EcoR124II protein [Bacteroides finegoldii]
MSKLQELIQELCPEGVDYKKLGELLDYEQPTKYIVKSTEYDTSYDIPVLTAGQTFILGYTNEKFGVYKASQENPTIIFDDFTTSFHWVDFEFKIKSSAMKMLRPKDTFDGSFKYVYYAMKCIKYEAVDHTRHWISKYSQFEIPVPPLEVQEEIVRILDHFTNLAAELQAELQARKEQYEYYRNKLLMFDKIGGGTQSVTWMKMSEIGTFIRGKRFVRTDIVSDGVPCIHYGDMYTYYGLYATQSKGRLRSELASKMRYAQKNDVVIVAAGENKEDIGVGLAWLGDEPAAVHDACFIFRSDLYPQYVSHYLRSNYYHKQIVKYVSEGKICSISAKGLGNAIIPIPAHEEQVRIATLLNNFDALVGDLTKGIPAEMVAVQEQYEYYRNKLLSFPRIQISV